MLTLTQTASQKVQDFILEHGVEGGVGLRVAVLPGGCSGFQYGLNIEDAIHLTDLVFPDGVELTIDDDRTVCLVSAPRAEAASEGEEEDEGGEAKEPEVIGQDQEED